jgi:hypothetical protein
MKVVMRTSPFPSKEKYYLNLIVETMGRHIEWDYAKDHCALMTVCMYVCVCVCVFVGRHAEWDYAKDHCALMTVCMYVCVCL